MIIKGNYIKFITYKIDNLYLSKIKIFEINYFYYNFFDLNKFILLK